MFVQIDRVFVYPINDYQLIFQLITHIMSFPFNDHKQIGLGHHRKKYDIFIPAPHSFLFWEFKVILLVT